MRASGLSILLSMLAVACVGPGGGDDGGRQAPPLTVYSGRNERLIGPLLSMFTEQTSVPVRVRYGGSAELTATLMEEGPRTPAHVFISQDAAALGALSRSGAFRTLPPELLERVPEAFRSPGGDWVGVTGRARVVVYNTRRISPDRLPRSLEETAAPVHRGRFGIAPGNASFQAHMALYSALNGEEALSRLLAGMTANAPIRYAKNMAIVEAVIAGEIDWGLVNHYYLLRALEQDPEAAARNAYMTGGTGSAFVNIAGVGLLAEHPAGSKLVGFLLSEDAQRYFAEETYEYPLVPGVAPAAALPPLDRLALTQVDYGRVADALDGTLTLIESSGLNRF